MHLLVPSKAIAANILEHAERRRAQRIAALEREHAQNIDRADPVDLYLRLRTRNSTRRSLRLHEIVPKTKPTLTLEQRVTQRRQERLANAPAPIAIQMRDAINMERAKLGLAPLHLHALLERSAQKYAEDMLSRDFFSHTDPEGRSSTNRMKAEGYGLLDAENVGCYCNVKKAYGENIAKGQVSVVQVVRDWMASTTGHREAILSRVYNDIGVGHAGDVWVLHFGGVEVIPVQ